jgi:hypothetical protein
MASLDNMLLFQRNWMSYVFKVGLNTNLVGIDLVARSQNWDVQLTLNKKFR